MQRFIILTPCLLLFAVLVGCQAALFEPTDHGRSHSLMGKSKNFFQPLLPDFSDQSASGNDDEKYAPQTNVANDSFEPRFNHPVQQPSIGSIERATPTSLQAGPPSTDVLPETQFPVVTETKKSEVAKKDVPKEITAPLPDKNDFPDKRIVNASVKDMNLIKETFGDDSESEHDFYEKWCLAKENKNASTSADDEHTNTVSSSSLINRAKQPPQYPTIPQLPMETQQAGPEAKYLSTASPQGNPLRGAVAQATWQSRTDWRGTVATAADQLRSQIEATPSTPSFVNEARLRMLHLLLDDCNAAVLPFSSYSQKEFNSYWANQMLAFSTLMDEKTTYNDTTSRFSPVAFRAAEGIRELKKLCPMKLKNVQFVYDWDGYGKYMPMPVAECRSGESIGLYMEIDNPLPNRVPFMGASTGYHVNVILNYEIRDASDKVVHKENDSPVDDMSLSLKADYSLLLNIKIPEGIPRGIYKIRVFAADGNRDTLQFESEELQLKIHEAN